MTTNFLFIYFGNFGISLNIKTEQSKYELQNLLLGGKTLFVGKCINWNSTLCKRKKLRIRLSPSSVELYRVPTLMATATTVSSKLIKPVIALQTVHRKSIHILNPEKIPWKDVLCVKLNVCSSKNGRGGESKGFVT